MVTSKQKKLRHVLILKARIAKTCQLLQLRSDVCLNLLGKLINFITDCICQEMDIVWKYAIIMNLS